MIDSHAHLYESELADDLENIIKRFRGVGGTYIVNCAADPTSCNEVIAQSQEFDEILPTVGLHPELVIPGAEIYVRGIDEKWIELQFGVVDDLIGKHENIIAVGECGLDYFWVKRERLSDKEKIYDLQRKILAENIKLALKHDLPLVLHCRDEMGDKQCEAEILDLLVKTGKGRIKGVFHSYTGSLTYLEDILGLGFYVSVNGIVTYKNADNVREILDAIPDDRLLLETDSPWLVPNRLRSSGVKICEPAFVNEVAEYVAKRKKISVERLWEMVDKNFGKLFKRVSIS